MVERDGGQKPGHGIRRTGLAGYIMAMPASPTRILARLRRTPVIALTLALAACHVTAPEAPRSAALASVAPPRELPAKSAATTSPASPPSARPSAARIPLGTLQPPAGTYQTLAGKVQVGADAVSLLGGQVVGSDVTLVTAGVITNNGSNAIPDPASGVDARSGGNVALSPDGSLAAAGVISNNGGALGGDGGSRARRLLGDTGSVPVAGMLVSAISLRDRSYLPVGIGPDGKPVYVVYTDANGGYKLYLPPQEAGNVVVAATAPAARTDRFSTTPTWPT